MIDLWPNDIDAQVAKAPVSVLKAQAALLGQKTDNLVEAKVKNFTKDGKASFEYQFFLESKVIGYSYRLFSVLYSINLYPVLFVLDSDIQKELLQKRLLEKYKNSTEGKNSFWVQSEEEFIDLLGEILKSDKTKQIIRALLAQVEAGDVHPNYNDIPF